MLTPEQNDNDYYYDKKLVSRTRGCGAFIVVYLIALVIFIVVVLIFGFK